MKRRINLQMLAIAGVGIAGVSLILLLVFFQAFRDQVFYDLKTDAHIMKYAWTEENEEALIDDEALDEFRITVIHPDGSVVFDSNADASGMDNHLSRSEVQDAFSSGEGQAVRNSETVAKNTYYYAILLDSGDVLRVSCEADNVWNFFWQTLPVLLPLLVILVILCVSTSRLVTRRIVQPIEALASDMTKLDDVPVYEEMQPLLLTVRRQYEELQKASDMRREFTANVSHELKTPLTSVSGYAELIEHGMVEGDDARRFAGKICACSARLLDLINDIIRLSQLDSTKPEQISFEPVNLYRIARQTAADMQIYAEQQDVTLTIYGQDIEITANRRMMEELVSNLMSNAIRYNVRGGKVRVSVMPLKDEVILSVRDTGVGLSPEDRERIFERFYRVDKSRSRATGGTGLGLAIVKHIVVQHGAKIEVESELGRGSEFRVTFLKQIPLEKKEDNPPHFIS